MFSSQLLASPQLTWTLYRGDTKKYQVHSFYAAEEKLWPLTHAFR